MVAIQLSLQGRHQRRTELGIEPTLMLRTRKHKAVNGRRADAPQSGRTHAEVASNRAHRTWRGRARLFLKSSDEARIAGLRPPRARRLCRTHRSAAQRRHKRRKRRFQREWDHAYRSSKGAHGTWLREADLSLKHRADLVQKPPPKLVAKIKEAPIQRRTVMLEHRRRDPAFKGDRAGRGCSAWPHRTQYPIGTPCVTRRWNRSQTGQRSRRRRRCSGQRSTRCCFADYLITDFPDYFVRSVRGFPAVFRDRRKVEGLAGCRTAIGASSRFAASALRSGPSGDAPRSARLSASIAVSGAFGHGPIARCRIAMGVLPVTATLAA